MNNSTYRIVESDSGMHGDLFEYVSDHFFDLIDNSNNQIIMTFQSESSGATEGSGWKNSGNRGVEKVVLSEDGRSLECYYFGVEKPDVMQLPQ